SVVLGEQQAIILSRADATRPAYPYAKQAPWLVFTRVSDALETVVQQLLQASGELVVTISLNESGLSGSVDQETACSITNPQNRHEFQSLLCGQLELKETGLKGIIYLWGRMAEMKEDDLSLIAKAQQQACGGLLTLIQTLTQLNVTLQQKL